MPLMRSRKNTAAASVEVTMAPSKRSSSQESPSKQGGHAGEKDGCEDVKMTPPVASARWAGTAESRKDCYGRAETGIEKDDDEYERASHIGERIIGELDAEAVHARRKAEHQEKQEEGRAESESD